MTFLTGWRIVLAADLLLEPGATQQGGLPKPVRAQHAFKRLRGISRKEHGALVGELGPGAADDSLVKLVVPGVHREAVAMSPDSVSASAHKDAGRPAGLR